MSVRETKWGRLATLDLGGLLLGQVEPIQFESNGRPHTHDQIELAICAYGTGTVVVGSPAHGGEEHVKVAFGDWVEIPAGLPHWMEPTAGQVLAMVILYRADP